MNEKEFAQFISEKLNNRPLNNFQGFSAFEMHQILYFPFSDDCPIKINRAIEPELLKLSPFFNISLSLLNAVNEANGIKLTQRGNLPIKIVQSIYQKRYYLNRWIEDGIMKARLEKEWIILHTAHIVLKISGILKKYHNRLTFTKKGRKYLENDDMSGLFLDILENHTMKFNWAYNDRYEDPDIGSIGFLYLLFIIKKFGAEYRERNFYADFYFRAFPQFLSDFVPRTPYLADEPINAFETRFIVRFAHWFGFIEYENQELFPHLAKNAKIKKTRLLDALLS